MKYRRVSAEMSVDCRSTYRPRVGQLRLSPLTMFLRVRGVFDNACVSLRHARVTHAGVTNACVTHADMTSTGVKHAHCKR